MSVLDAAALALVEGMADLTSQPIEGITAMGEIPFRCPLVTQVDGNLWQGGAPLRGVPAYFRSVLNLYPWASYPVPDGVDLRAVKMRDSHDTLPDAQLYDLARWVNDRAMAGPVLVHCQAGLNRSSLVVGLALVLRGMTPKDAIALLREKRSPAVLCNPTFERWLLAQAPVPA